MLFHIFLAIDTRGTLTHSIKDSTDLSISLHLIFLLTSYLDHMMKIANNN